tara:strand:- start:991 stop:1935 length:945 start_codon:yes stop_codon:yes gene_type:complete
MTYEILRETDVLDVRTPLKDLQITFQNDDIQAENLNLRIYAMRVTNNGETDILQTQYDQDQIWGLQVVDGRIIESRIIQSSSEYLRSKANPQVIGANIVQFEKAIIERGQFFAFNMLVVHPKDITPEIIPLGKIAGIDEIVVTWSPVEPDGPGLISELFGGGKTLQSIRAIVFFAGAAVVLGLFAMMVLAYSFLGSTLRRRKVTRSVALKAVRNQKQRDLLSEVFLHHGVTGVRDLREKLGNSERLELESTLLGTIVLAGESEFRIPPSYYAARFLEESEILVPQDGEQIGPDPEFQTHLDLFLEELNNSRFIL